MSEALTKPAGRSRPKTALLLGLGLVVFVILLGLGTWQVQRLYWKEALLQTIDQRTHSAPQPLADVEKEFAATGDVDYTPVTVSGTFLHSGERHFYATWDGDAGFNVYTPLALDDGRYVLINRGFVPYDLKDAAKRPQGQVTGKVTVTGLARNPLPGKPSMMLPDNDVAKNIFFLKDRDVWPRAPACRPVPCWCRSSSMPTRRQTLAACRSAASLSSICRTTTCNMPSPGTGWPPLSPPC